MSFADDFARIRAEVRKEHPNASFMEMNKLVQERMTESHRKLMAAREAAKQRSELARVSHKQFRDRVVRGLIAAGYRPHQADAETATPDKLAAAARKLGILSD